MTPREREEALALRITRHRPWHSPPHRYAEGRRAYIISAACYEHEPIIAYTAERLDEFSEMLLNGVGKYSEKVYAWCVMPEHYHVLVRTEEIEALLRMLGLLHGRTSYAWNGEESRRGRKVWFNYVERLIRSEFHLMSSINYIHHNPVKHGLVERWQDWPWSSAERYLAAMGRAMARENWRRFPVKGIRDPWGGDA